MCVCTCITSESTTRVLDVDSSDSPGTVCVYEPAPGIDYYTTPWNGVLYTRTKNEWRGVCCSTRAQRVRSFSKQQLATIICRVVVVARRFYNVYNCACAYQCSQPSTACFLPYHPRGSITNKTLLRTHALLEKNNPRARAHTPTCFPRSTHSRETIRDGGCYPPNNLNHHHIMHAEISLCVRRSKVTREPYPNAYRYCVRVCKNPFRESSAWCANF